MKTKMLNFLSYLVFISLSVLLLLPISAIAEGDGGWTTTASPGHIFQIEEDLYNNQKHLVMTVLKAEGTHEVHWGPASGSVSSTYQLRSMSGDSDMMATWQFNSVTQATVTVESCSTNCLWQSGQVVTLNKFFGDTGLDCRNATRVPKTGQTDCWDGHGKSIDCTNTGQDGEYQLGVLPKLTPYSGKHGAYTVYGWGGTRFTDNLDGTVTDNFTGLIWLKNANCFGKKNWFQALSDCNNLASGSCGLTDGSSSGNWRLPNVNELHSLVDFTQSDPALPYGHPFIRVPSDSRYWSSTTVTSGQLAKYGEAWYVDLWDGNVEDMYIHDYSGGYFEWYVWPVRGGN